MCPEGARVELERERCVPTVRKLSFEVGECEPLKAGCPTMEALRRFIPLVLAVLALLLCVQILAVVLCWQPPSPLWWQGLTLVHFSAQPERFDGIEGARRGCVARVDGVIGGVWCVWCFSVRHGSS